MSRFSALALALLPALVACAETDDTTMQTEAIARGGVSAQVKACNGNGNSNAEVPLNTTGQIANALERGQAVVPWDVDCSTVSDDYGAVLAECADEFGADYLATMVGDLYGQDTLQCMCNAGWCADCGTGLGMNGAECEPYPY